jgi:hypothetical protein
MGERKLRKAERYLLCTATKLGFVVVESRGELDKHSEDQDDGAEEGEGGSCGLHLWRCGLFV